ncbi:MAG: hypothetical protein Gaeavirus35_3 [Gaeavirus sp.]|uniref:Uncharacterized protein n=1 Tax=Gaeavirus sp. TaxID=2487767 RepID=A0A3G5A3D5_9VIRU|nr:MAG: hypothetical protein Gaeavirus35_3 [Gaeavirus sp.]
MGDWDKIIKKFKKLPYGCIVMNDKNKIILSSAFL